MVSFAALEEQLFNETGVGVRLRSKIGNGRFMGYNDGKTIEVLAPEAMSRIEGVRDPMDAARYVAWHELGHDYVSDKDPVEHARMDVGVINRLMMIGDYDAAREAVNIHRARARNASGNDRKFSEYALEMLGTDGDSAYGEFSRRYGGGLANAEEKSMLKRMYKSILASITEQYKPLDKPVENAKECIVNNIKALGLDILAGIMPNGSFPEKMIRNVSEGLKSVGTIHLQNISPLVRTMTIGFGTGRTNINRIYAYVDGDGGEWPIHWTMYNDTSLPDAAKLDEGISYVNINHESPLRKSDADRTLNPIFTQRHMRNYLGGEIHDQYLKHEMETIKGWICREDTKQDGGLWLPDSAAETALPPGYVGKVKVYRKNVSNTGILPWIGKNLYKDGRPMSMKMALSCAEHDFCQDIVGAVYSAPVAAILEASKVPAEGIRYAMKEGFKLGSNLADSNFLFRYN